jgi:copper chaperone CopZ
VTSAEVDFEKGTAVVKGKGVDPAALVKAVDDAKGGDYKATIK